MRSFIRQALITIRCSQVERRALALEAADRAEGLEEGVLERVARVVLRAQHAAGHREQPPRVLAHQLGEGRLVAGSQALQQALLVLRLRLRFAVGSAHFRVRVSERAWST